MLTTERILEAITEAIRCQRRFGPNYPTIFDLSSVVWDVDRNRIELDLIDEGKIRHFDLVLHESVVTEENLIKARENLTGGD